MGTIQSKIILAGAALAILFLSGCDTITRNATSVVTEVRDPRATVVLGTLNGRLGGGNGGSAEYCKFHSSANLPNCIDYEYDDKRGCKFHVKTPCPEGNEGVDGRE